MERYQLFFSSYYWKEEDASFSLKKLTKLFQFPKKQKTKIKTKGKPNSHFATALSMHRVRV